MSGLARVSTIPQRALIGGGLLLLLVIAMVLGVRSCDRREVSQNSNLVNQGVTAERDASKAEVINDVADAKAAVEQPSNADLQRLCHKYDRACQDGK